MQVSAAAAKTYYQAAYYAESGEDVGHWGGQGAGRLGLRGEVERAAFEALCDNRHPEAGTTLTPRMKAKRRIGYDISFHVPKSVSVLFGLMGKPEILDAFTKAVNATLHEMEGSAKTRVRRSGQQAERVTDNLVWASFIHTTARPIGGVPDPHLHCHAFVFNATFDPVENRWKAVELGDIKRHAPYYEAAFHARLAGQLRELGYSIRRTANGWEVAGVSEQVIKAFSRRTAQIEAVAAELGVTSPKEKDALGARTRESKRFDLSPEELKTLWRTRLAAEDQQALKAVFAKEMAQPVNELASEREAMAFAVKHCFERHSVIAVKKLLATALRRGVGQATVEKTHQELCNHGLMLQSKDGESFATTRTVLEEEARMLAFARNGRGISVPLGKPGRPFVREWLSVEQKMAAQHVLGSHDRVILMRGAAGTGKTALMQEVVEAMEELGRQVVTLAPSASASRGVLRSEGFATADTVARFLADGEFQERVRGQVLWVDEAGLLGVPTLTRLFAVAEKLGARVVLSGDRQQHASVERGAALRLLETEAGLVPAEVTGIRRQQGKYREAVRCLSEGRTRDGFDLLDRLGWVREVPEPERVQTLATEYVRALLQGKTALVVSPTHAEGKKTTTAIRTALQENDVLSPTQRTFRQYEAKDMTLAERQDPVRYEVGNVIEFHQNTRGFGKGQRCIVTALDHGEICVRSTDGHQALLPLDFADRFQVFTSQEITLAVGDRIRITRNGRSADRSKQLDNGAIYTVRGFTPAGDISLHGGMVLYRDYGHLTYGYYVTSHAAQGKTVDCVFIGQGSESFPASGREQFYVSVSRGKKEATIYTDDKQALRQAIQRVDPRLTASELMALRVVPYREWRMAHTQQAGRFPQDEAIISDNMVNQAFRPEHGLAVGR